MKHELSKEKKQKNLALLGVLLTLVIILFATAFIRV